MKDTIVTKRNTNPLVPNYKFSLVEMNPPTPPKFVKDSMEIDVNETFIGIGY